MRSRLVSLGLSALMLSQPAIVCGEQPSVTYSPDGPWVANWAADGCRISRTMRNGDGETDLVWFHQNAPSRAVQLGFASNVIDIAGYERVSVRFGEQAWQQSPARGTELEGFDHAMMVANAFPLARDMDKQNVSELSDSAYGRLIRPLDIPEEGQENFVEIAAGNRTLRFSTGALAPVFAALNACTSDLLADLGIDQSQLLDAVEAPELRNEQTILKSLIGRLSNGESKGAIAFWLVVNADGRVETCGMRSPLMDDKDSEWACRYTRAKARFEPGRNADGLPVNSLYRGVFTFFQVPF